MHPRRRRQEEKDPWLSRGNEFSENVGASSTWEPLLQNKNSVSEEIEARIFRGNKWNFTIQNTFKYNIKR